MRYRRSQHKKIIRDKNLFITIISLILVLALSLFISSNLARLIYKGSVNAKTEQIDGIENPNTLIGTKDAKNDEDYSEVSIEEYADSIPQDNIILFQGGVFNDLENAEEFRKKIEDNTLVSIVNDGKYERVILGVSTKNTFLDNVNLFKKNNIQFVKQVYEIPMNVDFNKEIIEIIDKFSHFIVDNIEDISNENIDISGFKSDVEKIKFEETGGGSFELFNDLRDLILELDDESNRKDLESIIDFIYSNFKEYRV